MSESQQLLAEYVKNGTEAAFRELVNRHIDLVYSTAVRLVNGDTHLAEDVAQTVFADLARMARTISPNVMLGGWLHRHTCFVARNILRGERRRQNRERQAVEMNSVEDHSAENLALVAPMLDEAIDELGAEDRTAILLRFFEQRNFDSVGAAMGSSEEAARKRVNRALDKLHLLLKRRGVVLSAVALASILSAEAVTAAPVGLGLTISSAALVTSATGGGTVVTILQIMSMKTKIGIVSAIIIAAAIPIVIQQQSQTRLRQENAALHQKADEADRLAVENKRLTAALARAANSASSAKAPDREVLKLRGEVVKMRTAASAPKTNGPSALSGITADPGMMKMLRGQQKAAMGMIYGDFAKAVKLNKEQSEKLSDLLADDVMENVGHITTILRDGQTKDEANQLFAQQDAALQEKMQNLLGPEAFSQYQDYTRNLASHLSTDQFMALLTGDKSTKDEQSKQLYKLMQEETQSALANAGLDPSFQTVPMLNFRNIAFQDEADKNLQLLDGIYEHVIARADSFLNADEIKKFGEFRTNAINMNRVSLEMNRKMMAPATQ